MRSAVVTFKMKGAEMTENRPPDTRPHLNRHEATRENAVPPPHHQ